MKHLTIIAFILVHAFFGLELGYTSALPLWKHLTFSFQHAGWMHLLVNSVPFFVFFKALQRHMSSLAIFLFAVVVAVQASFLYVPACGHPVVGSSGMVYAMVGMYAYFLIMQQRIDKRMAIFFGTIALSILISCFRPQSATLLHVFSLGLGICAMGFRHLFIHAK